ncbi:MAG TPA: phage tail sheath C-terminal domain-containing protein [Pyrinomonadaceae bacterium]
MPEYLAPGVYVEEISTGARPIEGVSTSTTGFVGQTERGPMLPRLVTSWEEYYRWYGGYIDRPPNTTTHVFLPYAARGFFDNGGQRLFIARIVPDGAAPATTTLDGDPGGTNITAVGPGAWGNNILVRVSLASVVNPDDPDANPTTRDWFRLTLIYYRDGIPEPFVDPFDPTQLANPARKEPDITEDFDNLSIDPTDPNFARSVVNASSRLISITAVGGKPAPVAFADEKALEGGENGDDDPGLDQYRGSPQDPVERRTGLLGLEAIRDISIIGVPDEVSFNGADLDAMRSDVLIQCERLKDRFAIFSATEAEQNLAINQIRPPQDSTYGAYYLPWVRVVATHTPEGHLLVPPTGHLAGIYARVDVERGVHKAPANEVVRGIVTRDLSGEHKPLKYLLNKQQQDILNPKGVNVIRDFRPDGRGIRVWGARTSSSDPMWKYINVRRLFIFIEQSIDRGTQWSVFEPNYEPTWTAIRLSITAFLRTVWRNGALAGVTPDEAFFVKCDRTTMTQDDWDNGRLICLIGVAPVKPAEFVIFRISQKTVESEQ